jgi:lysophospholipase
MSDSRPPDNLEARFQMPAGWRWHEFERDGRIIRFGGVMPQDGNTEAVIVGLQGVNEFCEKYFEIAHDMLARHCGFWMMDWHGQGKSGRYLPDHDKRHSDGFEHDIADLHRFIGDYVLPAAVKTDSGRLPLVMIAHSMGSNIGLRYLAQHKDVFTCAALTAPLTNIFALASVPKWLQPLIGGVMNGFAGKSYVPGEGPWKQEEEKNPIRVLSSDPVRMHIAHDWQTANPDLRIGGVTFGWVYHAIRSCLAVRKNGFAHKIAVPVIAFLTGKEHLVDNATTRAVFANAANVSLVEMPDSKHEIMMERDEIRNRFLKSFDDFLKSHDIKRKLTPF